MTVLRVLTKLTPASSSSRTGASTPLLDRARGRIRSMAMIVTGMFVALIGVSTLINVVFDAPIELFEMRAYKLVIAGGVIGGSLAVVVLARSARLGHKQLYAVAAIYQIVLVGVVSFVRHSLPREPDALPVGVSLAVVLIILFPIIVPVSSRRALVVGLLSAATEPLVLLLRYSFHETVPDLWPQVALVLPTFIAAVVAVFPARVVNSLGKDVDAARRLGSYRLLRRLGAGGMGEVWSAQHRLLARPAAIKLIRPDTIIQGSAATSAHERFEREAQVTASLCSPHTISLYDFGVTEDGQLYYVMELLDGIDLTSLVERFGPVPAERAVSLLRQTCDSLIDAHDAGLVHRDIKPANILACRYGHRYDFVKVLDFGLVKLHEGPQRDSAQLTKDGVITGTPAFLAPEAILGTGDIDCRIDLYALGCVGYWLLTGQLVFEADTPMAIAIKHVDSEPTPPSAHAEQPVPPALDALLLRCLAKAPDDRPQSAAEIKAALETIELAEAWTPGRARAWWEAHVPEDQTGLRESADAEVHSVRVV